MGSFASRQNAGPEEVDVSSNHAYKYPPRSGNYFGCHFIMGGERFDTPQPEAYLFGENSDLNFLGNKPTPFPYPPPQAAEPTKTLKSLINIRKESLRFVRIGSADNMAKGTAQDPKSEDSSRFTVEFTFDCDCRCAITIFYLCQEEVTPMGATYVSSNPTLTSETFHYKKGSGQTFCQPSHSFNPSVLTEDQLSYNMEREICPVAIHCVAEEPADEPRQSHTTIAVIDRHPDGTFGLRALKQKLYVDGLCYLLQEIYGIENKNNENKGSIDTDTEDNGSECVICMCDGRDTLILPCRHLCLCNNCADSLRYQANNCPICRAPFRALLQIRALQKTNNQTLPIASAVAGNNESSLGAVPAGYEAVSLIEALNGPVQTIRPSHPPLLSKRERAAAGEAENSSATQAVDALSKSNSELQTSRSGDLKDKLSPSSDGPATEFRMTSLPSRDKDLGQESKETRKATSPTTTSSAKRPSRREKGLKVRDRVRVVNEKREAGEHSENEADSEAEKLSPLLDASTSTDPIVCSSPVQSPRGDKPPRGALNACHPAVHTAHGTTAADDTEYYGTEEKNSSFNRDEKPENSRSVAPAISAGNTPIRTPGTPLSAATSHRSSGDSFSSSSSTRQLLPPIAIVSGAATSGATSQPPESSKSLDDIAMV
ncbi:probable E3 ubiquitin-protein ligase MGRN1 [Neocloeon triangulifer]|uniref:probable E3 ubiquitin-protein ligase MGRN1 n=1 Tax=Neocloeon triangulifer TaxID=2078957 RepID=UPI00286EF1BD|nr:probable E3 ubiquitin-protein ligase MGRN1 [Neocloeon triangulifer]